MAQRVGQIFKAMHQRRLRQIRREKQERIRSINQAEKRKLASINERIDAAAEGSKKQEQLMEERQNLKQKYDDEREKAQEKAQKKKAEAKRKQAKIDKATALFEIGVNTASAVAEALPNIPLSVTVGAMGAAQAAAVAAKPLPEVPEFAAGAVRLTREGLVEGPGGPREDAVPATLAGEQPIRVSAGESIINAASTEAAPRVLEEVNASPERARRVERVVAEGVTPEAMRPGYADGVVSIDRALTDHPVLASEVVERSRGRPPHRSIEQAVDVQRQSPSAGQGAGGAKAVVEAVEEMKGEMRREMRRQTQRQDEQTRRLEEVERVVDVGQADEELTRYRQSLERTGNR
jgi:hypothetical protein